MGVVLFMVISFVGISSSYARSENHINTPSVVVFGAPDANISAGNLSPMSTTHPPGGGGGGGGGGNPYPPVYYTIEIFGGNGEAEVSGDILSNGQTIMLIASTTYAIQAVSLASSYGFFQWETNSGSINNYESPSTSLNTGYSNGILTLVLNASANPWSGFAQSGSVQSVTGEFYVPSASYVGGNPNLFGIWVGIGGFSGTNLWQSGVAISVSSSGAETVTAFYETWVDGQNIPPVYNNTFQISPGDLLKISVAYSNGVCSFSISDLSTKTAWSGNSVSFTPNTQSAEWILENQVEGNQFGGNHYSLPDFGTVSWTDVSSNIGNLLYPVSALYFSVATNANYGYAYGGESFPGYLTSPGSFDVTYSPP